MRYEKLPIPHSSKPIPATSSPMPQAPSTMAQVVTRRVDVSAATFFRLLGVAVLVWMWLRLWPWVLTFVLAVFLAVTFDPLVGWLNRRRIPRWVGGPLLVLVIALAIGAFLLLAGAELKEQAGLLSKRAGEAREQLRTWIPDEVRQMITGEASGSGSSGSPAQQREQGGGLAYRAATSIVNAVLSILVALVLTAYLLIDGRRTYKWLVAFAAPERRPRIDETADDARKAIVAYMRGNAATSVLAAIVTFVVLAALKVPAALLLAVLAGILNFVPVIGLLLSLVPAVLLALTVSPMAAIVVVAFYLGYNVVESYYIQPKVYGHAMQMSSLAVLAAFAVGAELGGVLGALIALPLAAMYPAVESIWLKGRLGRAPVEDHRRIEQMPEH